MTGGLINAVKLLGTVPTYLSEHCRIFSFSPAKTFADVFWAKSLTLTLTLTLALRVQFLALALTLMSSAASLGPVMSWPLHQDPFVLN